MCFRQYLPLYLFLNMAVDSLLILLLSLFLSNIFYFSRNGQLPDRVHHLNCKTLIFQPFPEVKHLTFFNHLVPYFNGDPRLSIPLIILVMKSSLNTCAKTISYTDIDKYIYKVHRNIRTCINALICVQLYLSHHLLFSMSVDSFISLLHSSFLSNIF